MKIKPFTYYKGKENAALDTHCEKQVYQVLRGISLTSFEVNGGNFQVES